MAGNASRQLARCGTRQPHAVFGVPKLMTIALAVFAVLISARIIANAAQLSQVEPDSFEVASVRPNNSGAVSLGGVRVLPGGSVQGLNVSLRALLFFAFGLGPHDKIEGKSALIDQSFDVTAKAPRDVPAAPPGTVGPLNVMMRNLLTERFKLVARFEERAQEGYALVRSKTNGTLGPGLQPAKRCGLETNPNEQPVSCATRVIDNQLRGDGQDMERIARMLSVSLGRPVVDKTGILETFNVRMTFDQQGLRELAGQRPASKSEGTPSNLPSLFTALQEQLGLKLEAARVPTRVLIVEHVESPAPN